MSPCPSSPPDARSFRSDLWLRSPEAELDNRSSREGGLAGSSLCPAVAHSIQDSSLPPLARYSCLMPATRPRFGGSSWTSPLTTRLLMDQEFLVIVERLLCITLQFGEAPLERKPFELGWRVRIRLGKTEFNNLPGEVQFLLAQVRIRQDQVPPLPGCRIPIVFRQLIGRVCPGSCWDEHNTGTYPSFPAGPALPTRVSRPDVSAS